MPSAAFLYNLMTRTSLCLLLLNLVLLNLVLSSLAAPAAGAEWLRLEAGRFELYTNGSERAGRDALAAAGTAEQALSSLWEPLPAAAPEVRVYLFRNEGEFAEFKRGEWTRAFYQSGPDLDAVAAFANVQLTRSIRHEMVHRHLQRTTGPLPRWLEEGLAEYYSTVERTKDGVRVGAEIEEHARLLSNERWLPTAAWLEWDAATGSDARREAMFYAQSWAIAHRLMQSPTSRLDVRQFTERIRKGMPQREAFRIAFGRSAEKVQEEAMQAVGTGRMPVKSHAMNAAPDAPRAVTRVAANRAALLLCELHLMTGRPERAGELLAEISGPGEMDAEFVTAAALVALRRGDHAAAKAGLERAMGLGSKQGSTYFEYAMLLRDEGGRESEVLNYLRRTVEVSPSHAEAWFLLGRAAEKSGERTEAVRCYAKATEALPRQFVFWEALARGKRAAGDEAGARDAASRAFELARSPQEVAMAWGLMAELDAPKPAPAVKTADVVVPKGWEPPKGDAVVEGRLALVDCGGKVLKFHVLQGKQRVVLGAKDPGKIFLKGKTQEKREFVCGAQKGQPAVAVEYVRNADAKEKTAGDVVAIEFK